MPIRSTCCFRCRCTQLPVTLIVEIARRIAATEVLTGELDPNDKSRTTGRNQASQNHRCEVMWRSRDFLYDIFGSGRVLHWRLSWREVQENVASENLRLLTCCFKMFVGQGNVLLQKLPRPQQCELDHWAILWSDSFPLFCTSESIQSYQLHLKSIKVWLCHWVY